MAFACTDAEVQVVSRFRLRPLLIFPDRFPRRETGVTRERELILKRSRDNVWLVRKASFYREANWNLQT
jgi:hypothetical protein